MEWERELRYLPPIYLGAKPIMACLIPGISFLERDEKTKSNSGRSEKSNKITEIL